MTRSFISRPGVVRTGQRELPRTRRGRESGAEPREQGRASATGRAARGVGSRLDEKVLFSRKPLTRIPCSF